MPRIVGNRTLERLGPGTVFRSMSESRPGLFHLTVIQDNGSIRCSCEGFCMHGHCWHIDAIPLCMVAWEDDDVRGTCCWKVQGHEGEHSWQTKSPSS